MKRIDSKVDAALKGVEQSENIPLEIALKAATMLPTFVPLLPALDAVREHFLTQRKVNRILETLCVFGDELRALEQGLGQTEERVKKIEAFLSSDQFRDAVILAAEEATRTSSAAKIRRLGALLANGCDPEIGVSDEEELSSFVRDVSQLSELDIRTLEIVVLTARPGISLRTDVPDMADNMLGQHLVTAAAQQNLEQDDFYSYAYRLVGFGLLLEASPRTGRRDPNDLRFVPTRRGRKLLALLKTRV